MNTQPGRLLTEREMRDFRASWPRPRRDDGDAMCRCGHPRGQHTIQGECAIERVWRLRGTPCGCVAFVEVGR